MRRRLRAVIPLSFALVLALPVAPARASSTGSNRDVEMLDNVFAPRIVRIPVGGTVEWANEGRSSHDVSANDGSFASAELGPGEAFVETFASAELGPGEAFVETFATEGAYPYFCSIHGSPGAGMTGLVLVSDVPIPGSVPGVGPGRETPPSLPGAEIRVPKKRADDSGRGGRGRAGRHRPDLAGRLPGGGGRDNAVPDDPRARPQPGHPGWGGFTPDNGIQVIEADGVTIENMTARSSGHSA